MGRDWSKQRRQDQANRERSFAREDALLLDDAPATGPSKAEMRLEAEALMAAYDGPVRRLPTYAALRCRSCGHRGNARVPAGARPRFTCSHCGSSLVAWRI